ncbi:MAG: radical SAM protein [Clostridia bacterium]|nr:radical SAM protein [Clostridia bacterium]
MNVALFVTNMGCPHRCVFCDQNAIAGAPPVTREEIIAACETAERVPGAADGEIAFFGGSFTAVPRDYMLMCLETAYRYVEDGRFGGIRISTRPDCIDPETLGILKRYGVRAIELGAQSMDDSVLAANGRGHTAEDTVNASRMIKAEGFELGLQIMPHMYGSDDAKDIATARAVCRLEPKTVRIYPTVVLKNTALARLYEKGEYSPAPLESSVALCARLLDVFEQSGVSVIRLGLHSGSDVEKNLLAGPYHPAFRQLAESRRIFERVYKELEKQAPGRYTVFVEKRELSNAIGQNRENVKKLGELGYEVRFAPKTGVEQ